MIVSTGCAYDCEPLEQRRLLSTIVWVNRGIDDNFVIFGANAERARLTVDRAILDWSETIVHFNHAGGGNTFNLTVRAADLGGTARGDAGPRSHDGERVPTSGEVTIDDNAGNGAAGWYFDPVLGDDGEFNQVRGWWSAGTSIPGTDFYYVVLHEIGHCLGITSNPTYLLSDFLVDTGADDPHSGADLMTVNVNGGPAEATFTSDAHLYEGPAIPGRPDIPIHPEDLMNPGRTVPTNTNRRLLISDVDVLVLRDVYQYTVQFPNTINNMMVNPNFTTGVLTVAPVPGNFADTIIVQGSGIPNTLHVSVGPFMEIVPLSQTNRIEVFADGGNDIVRIEYNAGRPTLVSGGNGDDFIDFAFATRNLANITGATTVSGGNGNDSIFVYDNANPNFDSYLINTVGMNRTGFIGFGHQPDVEHLTLTTGTNHNPVNIPLLNATPKVYLHSAGGQDLVNIGGGTAGMSGINGDIEVQNNPSFTTINIDDRGSNTPRIATIDQASAQFGYLAGIAPGTIYWDNADIQDIFVTTGGGDDAINLRACSEVLVLQNGGGSDWVTVLHPTNGAQSVTATLRVNGPTSGAVTNLVVDNTPATANRTVTVAPIANGYNQITGLAPAAIQYRNVGKLVLRGGQGNDGFTLTGLKDDDVTVDGRGGFDALVVDDRPLLANLESVYLDDDQITRYEFAASYTVLYDDVESLSLYQIPGQLVTDIAGTSPDIPPGSQTSVFGNNVNNVYNVFPRDAQGNLTIRSSLGLGGGTGADSVSIHDGSPSLPINYRFQNLFGPGTTNITGLGPGIFGAASNIESITVNAGGGADGFHIDSFQSGSALVINAGGGDDVLNYGSTTLQQITNMSSFHFDGGVGSDTFNLNNGTHPDAFTYTRVAGAVGATGSLGAFYFLNETSTELVQITAGAQRDVFEVSAVAAGTELRLHAGGGIDQLVLGAVVGTLEPIRGPVTFNGGAGGGRMIVYDVDDPTGDVAHLTASTLGAFAGDTLFGPGGSLRFTDVVNDGASPGISLNLSDGADTVYAQPLASARVTINAFNPSAAPGDKLNLALAGAQNYVVTPGTSGNVAASNRQTLNWTGFEQPASVDDVPPSVTSFAFNLDGVGSPRRQAVTVRFSENVAGLLSAASVVLHNQTTNQTVPASNVAVQYDAPTDTATFTFPGYASGTLPDGRYEARVLAGLSDAFGNAMPADAVFNFRFLRGDATGDGVVNLADFNRLAANFGQGNRTFSQGDFNYDGTVNLQDFNLLASRFGQSVAPDGSIAAPRDPRASRQRLADLFDDLLA